MWLDNRGRTVITRVIELFIYVTHVPDPPCSSCTHKEQLSGRLWESPLPCRCQLPSAYRWEWSSKAWVQPALAPAHTAHP